ncbi:MAG: DUF1573 domain-containing protein [Prevotella sp.]|nr:DUF1573 domain-containing protein [Bacteroides sp.]MCM1367055.1 DUF1573 domain-containing protein [Prevotella sp.]MCM1437046.1 DUF1573 domain-containing protein [Prevotella sp.]
MKKLTLIAVIAAIIIPLFSAQAKKKNDKGEAKPRVTENVYNFGTIKESKGPVSHDFTITNVGDGQLIIYDATAQCGCTRPEYPKNPISAGKACKIKVTYNPAGRPGAFDKTVTVKTNGNPRKTTLRIKGTVIPD